MKISPKTQTPELQQAKRDRKSPEALISEVTSIAEPLKPPPKPGTGYKKRGKNRYSLRTRQDLSPWKRRLPFAKLGKYRWTPKWKTRKHLQNALKNSHLYKSNTVMPLRRIYSIESMDSDTDHIIASLNLEEVLNNYNTWNYLTVGQLISSVTFLNVNLLHIIHIYLNVYKQMTDVKLLLLRSNAGNHLAVCEQVKRNE